MSVLLEQMTRELGGSMGLVFDVQYTGHREWVRVFVHKPQKSGIPLSLGRLSFKNGKLWNANLYSDKWFEAGHDGEFRDFDRELSKLMGWVWHGCILGDGYYDQLCKYTKEVSAAELKARIGARAKLPKKKRKALKAKDPRFILRSMIREGVGLILEVPR